MGKLIKIIKNQMDMAFKYGLVEKSMKDISRMGSHTVKECFLIMIEKNSTVIFSMEKPTEKENTLQMRDMNIKVNTLIMPFMEMVIRKTVMALNIVAALKMDKE